MPHASPSHIHALLIAVMLLSPAEAIAIVLLVGLLTSLGCWVIYAWPGGEAWDDRWALRLNRVELPGPVDAVLRWVSYLGLFPVNGAIWLALWLYILSHYPWDRSVLIDETPLLNQSVLTASLSYAFTWTAPIHLAGAFCLFIWGICRVLKRRTSRPRPFESLRDEGVQQRGMLPSGSSFPSSHAAMVWYTWPLLVALFWGDPLAIVWLVAAVALATLVSYTRVYLGAHFPRDVLAGTVLGVGFAFAAYMAGGRAVPWLYQLLF